MQPTSVHRELILPNPRGATEERPRGPPPISIASPHVSWLELHRARDGTIRYCLGTPTSWELNLTLAALQESRAGLHLGPKLPCPLGAAFGGAGHLFRARARERSHYWPIRHGSGIDRAGTLIRTLAAPELRGQEIVLQLLFRRVPYWEFGFLSSSYDVFLAERTDHPDKNLLSWMHARKSEPPFHVEMRAGVLGPDPKFAHAALQSWVSSWTSARGNPRWSLEPVLGRKRDRFFAAFRGHDIRRFRAPRSRRDVSGSELSSLMPVPWRDHHPEVRYAGAPMGRLPTDLAGALSPSEDVVIGSSDGAPVRLPDDWNHLAVLGRTQSGKSSFALNLVLQVLAKRPDARVVVMEPTGELIRSVVTRIGPACHFPIVEIDPAHPTFDQGGTAMVAVPINPLALPDGSVSDPVERERQQEVVVGGILQAFRCAWGPESIGGRAEFVLRAVLQGLLATERSNLVDAYYLLSDKQALARFVRGLPPGPLRPFLETHLPRLDYAITISSLDKLGKIATNPLLRVALCQRAAPVPFDRILENRLVLLNLSKGALGADGANFLGAIYLSLLWGAIQRTGRPDKPVYLVVDEAQNYPIPVLSEMLSEGRKFGLHVVLVTQYLDWVAEGLRTALLGNVDTWALFPLGADDARTAHKIANGERHGWTPQDFAEGLYPRQFALVRSGTLIKVDAMTVPPPSPAAAQLEDRLRSGSDRYAQPEDSEASPWLVGMEEVEGVLRSLSRAARTREEVTQATPLPPIRLDAALARSEAAGDVVRSGSDRRYHLTARGSLHLRVLENRGSEGEEHVETLVGLAVFLEARGIVLSIPRQVPGVSLPDAQFHWGDSVYNVEVECSTVTKAADQVVRNVRKGLGAGYNVLVVLADPAQVRRVLALLEGEFRGLRLWADGVGIVTRESGETFSPVEIAGAVVWPFLSRSERAAEVLGSGASRAPAAPTETDPLLGHVRVALRAITLSGRSQATPQEILAALPPTIRSGCTEQQVGIALRALGLRSHRSRVDGERLRLYDLTGIGSSRVSTDPKFEGGPTPRPDADVPASTGGAGPAGRADEAPPEPAGRGPTWPDGPDD